VFDVLLYKFLNILSAKLQIKIMPKNYSHKYMEYL